MAERLDYERISPRGARRFPARQRASQLASLFAAILTITVPSNTPPTAEPAATHASGSAATKPRLLSRAPSNHYGAVLSLDSRPDYKSGWLVYRSGTAIAYGGAPTLHDHLATLEPIVATAATPEGSGYWLVTRSGTVLGVGNARTFNHSAHFAHITGIAPSSRDGYLLLTRNGQVLPCGPASFYGEPPRGQGPFLSIISTSDLEGYWIVNRAGHVFSFGDAHVYARNGDGSSSSGPISLFAVTRDEHGYWEVHPSGTTSTYGDAITVPPVGPHIAALLPAPNDNGLVEIDSEGSIYGVGRTPRWQPSPQNTPHGAGSRAHTKLTATTQGIVGSTTLPTTSSSSTSTSATSTTAPAASGEPRGSPPDRFPTTSSTVSTQGTSPTTTTSPAPAPSKAFTMYVGPGNPSGLAAVGTTLGVTFATASDYFADSDWADIDDDQWDIGQWEGSGYRMIWAVPMLPVGNYTLADGAAGDYDAYFAELARNLIAAGMGDSIIRLGAEFNSPTNPWYAAGQATAFVDYWQQIVTTMRGVAGASFLFEWNVNRGDNGGSDAAMGNYALYYPGNNFVDIIGMDIYDLNWDTYPGATAEFEGIVNQQWGLSWLAAFASANNKPIGIGEFGLGWGKSSPDSGPVTAANGPTCGGDDPTFINDMASWISSHNVVSDAFYDEGTSSIENGQNPLTADALYMDFGAGR